MIILIEGAGGAGKSWLMTRILYNFWRKGTIVAVNYPVSFGDNEDVRRWYHLEETYNLTNCAIGIDEGQGLFGARQWNSLPIDFSNKICQERGQKLDIVTTTRDFLLIDYQVRVNVHELYKCRSLFRLPWNQRVHPIFQIIRVKKFIRQGTNDDRKVYWRPAKLSVRIYFISRYWTKAHYDTYSNVGFEKFLCRVYLEGKKWKAKIVSREGAHSNRRKL
jgi:hypothetical protein